MLVMGAQAPQLESRVIPHFQLKLEDKKHLTFIAETHAATVMSDLL